MGLQEGPPGASAIQIAGRIVRGSGALLIGAVVNVLSQLAIVPLALRAWGTDRYGEWVVLTAYVSFLTMTDLGIQTYVVNRLCAHHTRGDRVSFQHDLASALRAHVPLALGSWIVIVAILVFSPIERLFHLYTVPRTELIIVLICLAGETLSAVPLGVFGGGVYRATGRLSRAAMFGALQRVCLLILTCVLLIGGVRFSTLAACRFVFALCFAGVYWYDVRRQLPWLKISLSLGRFSDGVSMVGPGLLFLLIPLSDLVSLQGTVMVLQSFHGGTIVSQFTTHRTVVNIARMLSGLLTFAVWPELTALAARGENSRLARAHRTLAKLNGWLVGAVALTLIPMGRWLYPSWTLGRLAFDPVILGILVAQTCVWGTWTASVTALSSGNRQRNITLTLAANALLVIALGVVLIPAYGIRGAAAAGLLGDLMVAAWIIPSLACRHFGDEFLLYVKEVGRFLVLGLAVPLLIGAVVWSGLPLRGPFRTAAALLAASCAAAWTVWICLSPAERALGQKIFRISPKEIISDAG